MFRTEELNSRNIALCQLKLIQLAFSMYLSLMSSPLHGHPHYPSFSLVQRSTIFDTFNYHIKDSLACLFLKALVVSKIVKFRHPHVKWQLYSDANLGKLIFIRTLSLPSERRKQLSVIGIKNTSVCNISHSSTGLASFLHRLRLS